MATVKARMPEAVAHPLSEEQVESFFGCLSILLITSLTPHLRQITYQWETNPSIRGIEAILFPLEASLPFRKTMQ